MTNVLDGIEEDRQLMLKALRNLWISQKEKEDDYQDLAIFLLNFFQEKNWNDSIEKLKIVFPDDLEGLELADLGVLAKLSSKKEILEWLDSEEDETLVDQN